MICHARVELSDLPSAALESVSTIRNFHSRNADAIVELLPKDFPYRYLVLVNRISEICIVEMTAEALREFDRQEPGSGVLGTVFFRCLPDGNFEHTVSSFVEEKDSVPVNALLRRVAVELMIKLAPPGAVLCVNTPGDVAGLKRGKIYGESHIKEAI